MKRGFDLETIAGRVNANGTIDEGDGFTVLKGSAGVYTILLPKKFRVISATASAQSGYCITTSFSENSFQVYLGTVASPSAATDNPFAFIAAGVQQ